MATAKSQRPLAGLCLLIGFVISFFLFFLGVSGIEIAWTLQMPGFWIGDALGLGVHGALYLVGTLMNSVLYGVGCFLMFLDCPVPDKEKAFGIIPAEVEKTGDPKYRACPQLKKYVAAGWLGRKSGQWFYSYGA